MRGTRSEVEVARPTVDDVFSRAYVPLCRLALVILGDERDAEEVVMEAFERTMPRWESIGADQPEAYLRRSVVNLCRNRIRRTGLWRRTLPRLAERPAGGAVDDVGRDDTVWSAVGGLPAGQRLCVALFYYEDLPQDEIARILDCSVGTVKSQLSKARATLAAALDEEALS
jgi:RNA polymerase sigma factor (sigma-70 family)